ncbi:3-hydroxyacyl-CoA dehydrogenase NAD-binding domain-containing protein [Acinetobacter nosocomialis]|uniref:3-hydroxyacyl-CoA dehydrogenase NAD-binding domain-containing protein n=1 Tax=Acinetobacter nosocomialis TaxID=106654 RepID=UPI0029D4AF1F|nr:3-hydroxyacyl-CoA dehydrogenase NAD-binding domain-containing protein [Acinetobacter nosocomialis]MDX7879788.1 3-hydroxyacyl-CoA dehydrogenase NAD-binding domain-containing protein [Acinetobacter nosocomialis]
MEEIKTIGVVGVGVIGASWTALFLYKGFKVKVYDPYPIDEQLFKKRLQANLKDLSDLDLQTQSSRHLQDVLSNLELYNNLKDAVTDVDFIQENAPERLDIKQKLYQDITSYCPEKTLIASSSSGLKVSDFQKEATHPERIFLGHPFNPPHLLPLVEIVGGKLTDPQILKKASEFYQSLGKHPIILNKEVKGHVANRLQAALWREAFSLVKEGVCSAEDVDIAITSGPGLRWALFGPYINMELANQKGFKEAIHHLGPPMTEWWNDMQTFQHSDETTEMLEAQTKELLTHYKHIDLSQKRDKGLVDILKLRQQLKLD